MRLQREKAYLGFTQHGLRLPLESVWSKAETEIPYAELRAIEFHSAFGIPFVSIGIKPNTPREMVAIWQMDRRQKFVKFTSNTTPDDDYSKSRFTVPIEPSELPRMQQLFTQITVSHFTILQSCHHFCGGFG